MMSYWTTGSWGWGSAAAMTAMMLLFLILPVGLAVWAAVWATRSTSRHTSFETPRATLDRRLASGEITDEQYNEARRLLTHGPVSSTG